MKRILNKQGFTLVELLAVIVVLAIILVITVPIVLNSISSTRQDALQISSKKVEKYVQEQLTLEVYDKNEILNGTDADNVYYDSDGTLCASSQYMAGDICKKVDAITTGEYGNFDDYAIPISSLTTSVDKFGLNDDYDLDNSAIAWDSKGNVVVKLVGAEGKKFDGITTYSSTKEFTAEESFDAKATSIINYAEETIKYVKSGGTLYSDSFLQNKLKLKDDGTLCASYSTTTSACASDTPVKLRICKIFTDTDLLITGFNSDDFVITSSPFTASNESWIAWDTEGNIYIKLIGKTGGKYDGLTIEINNIPGFTP